MERLPGIDSWGSSRKVEREKRDRPEKDFWVLLCPMKAFSFGVYSKNCTKYVNCLSITIYMNVLRRWSKVQGDKAAFGPCLYSQDLGNCLQSCLGQLDMTEEWILCPVIRIMSLSAPFIPLYHPASCESPFWSDWRKEAESVSSMWEILQQLSLFVILKLCERAEARKDNGGDRNYVKNSCISLHLVQGGVKMFIKVHLIWKQIT